MPFREQDLDTGFTAYQGPAPEPVAPAPGANPLAEVGAFVGSAFNPASAIKYYLDRTDTYAAAFRMENDIVNTVDLLTRPTYTPDPTFDVVARLKTDQLWNDYAYNFLGVSSEAEYLAVSGRIAQEEKDRLTLQSAGAAGLIAQMAAGLVSPTALIPFVGGARGAKAVGLGISLGFAGGVAQEVPLQLAQETRSLQESVSSIAMSTVVGGLLGGAVAFARRTPDEIAEALIPQGDMVLEPGSGAIPKARSAGAAAAREEAPEIASAFGLEKSVGQMSPVVRSLTQPLDQGRWMMAQLADAGLEYAGSKAGAIGGNIENRIKTYYGPVDKTLHGVDDAYARYWFGAEGARKPLAVKRANLAGLNPNREKMSRKEFKEAVGIAMNNGDQHQVPEVAEVAAMIRKNVLDPVFKRAQEVGIYRTLEEGSAPVGDLSYLNRVYNIDLIQARQVDFEAILAKHYEGKITQDFQTAFLKLNESTNRLNERAEDFGRSADEIAALREEFEVRLRSMEESNEDLVALEDAISDERATARTFPSGSKERGEAAARARALEQEGGEALAEARATRSEIKRRLGNLRRAHSTLTAKQEAKLSKIARAEELSFNTLQRLVRKGQKILASFDKFTDEKLASELSGLKDQFAETARRYDKNEERIAAIFDDDFEADVPTSPFVQAAKVETGAFDKMTSVAEAIDGAEVFDRLAAREMVQAGLDDAIRRAQGIVERRAVRNARLADQAEKLDPEAAAKRIEGLRADARLKRQEFMDSWRERGADDIDPVTGLTDFKRASADMARQTTNKILGTYMRLPGIDMLGNAKGVELARVLDIDSKMLRTEDGHSFLEMDAEKLMMQYVRTLAPDIELTRSFGPDFMGKMQEGTGQLNENWKKLDDEYNARLANTQAQMKAGVNPETGKPRQYTQEQMDKKSAELAEEYKRLRRDLEAVVGRLRHTWGVPADPRGFGARAARIASNVNTLRFMSNVAISSIPDLARPIMKYGLLRTFRQGYVPFVKALAEGNFSPRQLRIMGAALDVSLHSRAAQVYDIGDYMVRGSKFEKGLEYATSKIGLVGLFDYWTVAMKQISGAVANARAMEAIELVAGGGKGSQKDLDEAIRFLSANGIDDDYALRIWKQLEAGGGDVVGGQRWPNTEDWTDTEATTAYNAMLVREIDNSIVTPGVERPLMVDANPYARLLFQFKSFGMSSTTKTFLAGAQGMKQGDMAFVTGGIISLALGTLSYYTYANIVGGAVKARMESAIEKGEWELFADEAINRAGLLGIGADIQSAFAATPLADYVTFSGERSTRRGGDNLLETLAGPTFGDLAPRSANIAAGIGAAAAAADAGGDPMAEVPWGDVRRLAPWQNHFILRQLYDEIEQASERSE